MDEKEWEELQKKVKEIDESNADILGVNIFVANIVVKAKKEDKDED